MVWTVRAGTPPPTDGVVRRLRVDGVALRTRTLPHDPAPDAPPTPGRDVVLVHGLGASSATFARMAPHLTGVGAVHLLDLPGFARVPRAGAAPRIEDLARLVTRWAQERGLHGAVLVGHSMGAQVVAEVAAATPGVASHVVLVGPVVDDRADTVTRQMVRLAASTAFEPHRTRAVLLRGVVQCGPRWYAAVLRQMLEHPVADRVRVVTVPVLVVRGEHDRVAPADWVARLAAAAPDGRAVTVAGAAHAAVHGRGRQVADLVLEHVRR